MHCPTDGTSGLLSPHREGGLSNRPKKQSISLSDWGVGASEGAHASAEACTAGLQWQPQWGGDKPGRGGRADPGERLGCSKERPPAPSPRKQPEPGPGPGAAQAGAPSPRDLKLKSRASGFPSAGKEFGSHSVPAVRENAGHTGNSKALGLWEKGGPRKSCCPETEGAQRAPRTPHSREQGVARRKPLGSHARAGKPEM